MMSCAEKLLRIMGAAVCQVAWSADSRMFVSGSKDSTLKVRRACPAASPLCCLTDSGSVLLVPGWINRVCGHACFWPTHPLLLMVSHSLAASLLMACVPAYEDVWY